MAIFSALVCPAGPFWLSTKATCPLAAPDPVFVLFFNTKARHTLPLATSTSRSKTISTLRLVWSGEEGRGARGGGAFLWPGESVTAPPGCFWRDEGRTVGGDEPKRLLNTVTCSLLLLRGSRVVLSTTVFIFPLFGDFTWAQLCPQKTSSSSKRVWHC